jgi:membrane fusion protein, copper/silver efflux system
MKAPAKIIAAIFLAVGIFFTGYLANRQKDPTTSLASVEQAVRYICPMHPQYTSDHSGVCPICGMSLVPASSGNNAGNSASPDSDVPGTVQISTEKQQLSGVRTDKVQQVSTTQLMRMPGRITVDESRLYRIIAAADGWILTLGDNPAGTAVKRNQLLATYYTPSMVTSQQSLLYALGRSDQQQKKDVVLSLQLSSLPLNLESALDSVRNLGMDDTQILELQRTRKYISEIQIHSPVTGYVLSRNVSPEQRFDKSTELYRIADIRHVWVMTDVYEKDREFLNPGAQATVHYQGRKFQARMSNALPQFDPESRLLKTRFELDNPGQVLLPDIFVDVELEVKKPAAITVPADAIIDSGRRKTVYVEHSQGEFEPRLVQVGWRLGDRVQITNGLEPGERIVVSGNFLIDSESRMRMPEGTSAMSDAKTEKAKDLVCGMDVDPKAAGALKTQYKGETYYFCSEMCKKSFEANPEKYIPQKAKAAKAEKTKDLVCGMAVDPNSANVIKTQYQGKTYYFCSEMCKKNFEANPEKYVHKTADTDIHGMHGTE